MCYIKSPISTVVSRHLFTKNSLYFFIINPQSHIISHLYPICSYNNILAVVALRTNLVHFANNLCPLLPPLHHHQQGGLGCSPLDKDAH